MKIINIVVITIFMVGCGMPPEEEKTVSTPAAPAFDYNIYYNTDRLDRSMAATVESAITAIRTNTNKNFVYTAEKQKSLHIEFRIGNSVGDHASNGTQVLGAATCTKYTNGNQFCYIDLSSVLHTFDVQLQLAAIYHEIGHFFSMGHDESVSKIMGAVITPSVFTATEINKYYRFVNAAVVGP